MGQGLATQHRPSRAGVKDPQGRAILVYASFMLVSAPGAALVPDDSLFQVGWYGSRRRPQPPARCQAQQG